MTIVNLNSLVGGKGRPCPTHFKLLLRNQRTKGIGGNGDVHGFLHDMKWVLPNYVQTHLKAVNHIYITIQFHNNVMWDCNFFLTKYSSYSLCIWGIVCLILSVPQNTIMDLNIFM